ncbi:hypothetical protein [Ruegeria sp. EL01]|jgi:predicted metallo-beta-lactamase superfamily hydrolase|uniref:hypothetical protein n=1 Tax=Ruegeria sp. EL01 TaxID=2107578 RepID=UPI000EA82AF1|nr:hypothetical protein [Ruegeria sp. EL01]
MMQTVVISHSHALTRDTRWRVDVCDLHMKLNKKGGTIAADAVYTNAPTQPQYAQAHGLCIARGKRNTHGVRTNG